VKSLSLSDRTRLLTLIESGITAEEWNLYRYHKDKKEGSEAYESIVALKRILNILKYDE